MSTVGNELGFAPGGRAAEPHPSGREGAGQARKTEPSTRPGAERETRAPLSLAQRRLWFLEQLEELGSAYHVARYLRLRGGLDAAALARALTYAVARHDALRSTFHEVEGVPEQRIAPAGEVECSLAVHELGGYADAEAELRRRMAAEVDAPLDLRRGPVFRFALFRLAPDEHVLLMVMHHIMSDAWSLRVLGEDVGALYAAALRGEGDPLPPHPVPYAEQMARRSRALVPELVEAKKEYWRQALAGVPALLDLPTDHPRPARQRFGGDLHSVRFGAELTAGLKALGERHGTTLFRILLAGWAVVAGRLAGQEDVVLGVPMGNRDAEAERMIGFFVDTVALRVDLSGSPTVAELLRRVHERTREAKRHQDVPLEDVVNMVAPVRSLAYHPLFQAGFSWANVVQGRVSMPGLRTAPLEEPPRPGVSLETSWVIYEDDGEIAGSLEYATALFEPETVARYAGYLRRVLEEMVADDGRPVDRLSLLPADERARVLEGWNRTDAEYPGGPFVHARFERQADLTPDAVAVSFEDASLTYAELNRRANRLAHHLRALGAGPDVRVGIGVERSLEMVVGLVAVAKAGGAYVPLDPEYPAERLRHMLADSRPAVLLTQARLRDRFAAAEIPALALDADAASWSARPETNPSSDGLTPEHLAYVIYTSGSTGLPKAVMVPHRGLLNHTAWQVDRIALGAGDTFLQRSTISFDASNAEVWDPLVTGARMHVVSLATTRDPAALGESIRRHGITVAQFVPTLLQAVLDALPAGAALPLRRIVCAGEVLTGALAARAREAGCALLLNHYGPTEASIDATWHPCGEADGETVPIGRPLANTRVYVLDGSGEPVPAGVAGELYVGGTGVARGYGNRPELTAETFVADPFGGRPGARLYRTGDLARWRADGTVEFLGRVDHQVKIRGFRIELGEIEARLAEHPGVREAAVLARGDAPGSTRLVAYVVGDEAAGADVLRAHLRERLPEYMVPAAYVRLDTLPLTATGKLDRNALPAPAGDAFARRGHEAPVGETEEALAEIWAEVLGIERVGRWDDFFELGGHSLLAGRLMERMRRRGLHAEVDAIFQSPTLAEFAASTDVLLELRL